MDVAITVNGVRREADLEARTLLVDFIRDHVGLTGTKIACDTSQCGSCTVDLDGMAVKSCTVLAVQADGKASHDHRGAGVERRRSTRCRRRSGRSTGCSAATARPG